MATSGEGGYEVSSCLRLNCLSRAGSASSKVSVHRGTLTSWPPSGGVGSAGALFGDVDLEAATVDLLAVEA